MSIRYDKVTIQIGNTILDVHDIQIDMKPVFTENANDPTWVKEAGKVVDGSIVQPVTDPARLLETKEGK